MHLQRQKQVIQQLWKSSNVHGPHCRNFQEKSLKVFSTYGTLSDYRLRVTAWILRP